LFARSLNETAIDQLDAVAWAFKGRWHVVFVAKAERLLSIKDDRCTVLSFPQSEWADQFTWLVALQQFMRADWQIGQIIYLEADTLLIGKGLDGWAASRVKQNAGVIGVPDRLNYSDAYLSCSPLFAEWGVPHELWDAAPNTRTPLSGVLVLSYSFAKDLFHRQLLPPPTFGEWRLTVGAYLAWVAQMLNYEVVLVGSMDRPEPPIYANYWACYSHLPPPQILSPRFLVYHSLLRIRVRRVGVATGLQTYAGGFVR
jgi:hypothetical protein